CCAPAASGLSRAGWRPAGCATPAPRPAEREGRGGMREYLPFLVIGLASGSIYAIAAMGLVVTYKTSGVFNFAHGAVGMIATFIFYSLRVDAGVPTWLAAALAILVVAPLIGVVIDRVLLRRLRGASASSYVVVSLGLLVGLQYLA